MVQVPHRVLAELVEIAALSSGDAQSTSGDTRGGDGAVGGSGSGVGAPGGSNNGLATAGTGGDNLGTGGSC